MGMVAWHGSIIVQRDDEKILTIYKDGQKLKEVRTTKKNLSYLELERILKAYAMEWEV